MFYFCENTRMRMFNKRIYFTLKILKIENFTYMLSLLWSSLPIREWIHWLICEVAVFEFSDELDVVTSFRFSLPRTEVYRRIILGERLLFPLLRCFRVFQKIYCRLFLKYVFLQLLPIFYLSFWILKSCIRILTLRLHNKCYR